MTILELADTLTLSRNRNALHWLNHSAKIHKSKDLTNKIAD